jgi:hypothetical protein
MKKKIYFITLFLFVLSCNSDKNINGIIIPNNMIDYLYTNNYESDYINTLKLALEKNNDAIVKFSILNFDSSVGMEHGEILLNLIKSIGEKNYVNAVKNCSAIQKQIIKENIENGIEWSVDSNFKDKNLSDIYPALSQIL